MSQQPWYMNGLPEPKVQALRLVTYHGSVLDAIRAHKAFYNEFEFKEMVADPKGKAHLDAVGAVLQRMFHERRAA